MSSQFARLKHALNRAETTSVGLVQVTVFADDLHSILAHYITVSTELAELKAASATEVCAVIPSIREYVESLESRFAKARMDALAKALLKDSPAPKKRKPKPERERFWA